MAPERLRIMPVPDNAVQTVPKVLDSTSTVLLRARSAAFRKQFFSEHRNQGNPV
jgi:hypothetical protein